MIAIALRLPAAALGALLLAGCAAGSTYPAASFAGVPHGERYLGCWLLETLVQTRQGPSRDQALIRLDSLVDAVRGPAVVAKGMGFGGLLRSEGRALELTWSVRGRHDTLRVRTRQPTGPDWRLTWYGDSLVGRAAMERDVGGSSELGIATATRVSCSGTPLSDDQAPDGRRQGGVLRYPRPAYTSRVATLAVVDVGAA